jgi:hypothetical protein
MKIKAFLTTVFAVPAFLILVLAVLVLAAGCGTGAKAKRWDDVGTGHETISGGGVKVSARYLTLKALRTLHGYNFNPFADSTEWPSSVIVVDVTVESSTSVDVRAGEAVLETVAEPKRPIPKEEFKSFWYTTLEDSRDMASRGGTDPYNMWSYAYVRDLVDRTVLPPSAAVEAGGKVSGYLLFGRRHADKGPATLTVPVYDETGGSVGDFKFQFAF